MTQFKTFWVTFFFLYVANHAFGENDNQSIIVESDSAERNESTGVTQYSGNVIIQQGSLIIDANMVEIHYVDNRVSRIICKGNTASYQNISSHGGQVLARAETIEYLPEDKVINLKTNASLFKSGTLIKGDSINYDVIRETWRAKGDNQTNQKRIQLVIPPLKKTEDNMKEKQAFDEVRN
jgi:lipopolysaccharide export system protein LptA